jgi:uncharacterized phiE125 gp8 family phage protein
MAQYSKIAQYTGAEIITLAEAKLYLRVDYTTDDSYITDLIKIVRVQILKDTNQVLVSQVITEYFSEWTKELVLQYPGTLSSYALRYYDSSNTDTLLVEGTDYRIIECFGLVKLEIIQAPTLYNRLDAIRFDYIVAPQNSDSIAPLKIALYMLLQHYYDNRSAVSFLKAEEMPLGYKSIIANYKNYIL